MARTWSVPQRGSIAAFGGPETHETTSHPVFLIGRSYGHRGIFLLLAALLTFAGAIVPQLDSQLLSTLLFLAGAGLAVLVILPSAANSNDAAGQRASRPMDGRTGAGASKASEACFAELLTASPAVPTLDRAAWAKLTAHMSHELRTPLNAVLGFSELMTNEVFGPLGANYSAYARDIHASGRNLLKSAEDALAITALLTATDRKRSRATSRLNSVIDEACAFAAPDLTARSVAVAIDAGADVEIIGDHQAIRQMLINLIAEAMRQAGTGAVLRIETLVSVDAVDVALVLLGDNRVPAVEEGFGMILARTLCELTGAELTSGSGGNGAQVWNVRLLPACQADLFAFAA